MSARVIIVRHGQSSYNIEQRIQGRCDKSVLTERGRADAEKVGAAIANLQVDAFFCSPLQRARQTAEIVRSRLSNPPPLQANDRLMEVDLPLWEELTKDEVIAKYPEDYRCWKERPHEFCMRIPSGDGTRDHYPVRSLFEQAQQFWQEIIPQHPGRTILIVAHNGINRCLIASAIGIPIARYHCLQQSNCCINVLNFTGNWGDTVQLESLNQTTHLGIPLPPPRSPRGLRLLLVRHGETQWNRESRFQGQIDIPLNETGKEQGAKAAEFLQSEAIDFAISSTLSRPKETAEIILQKHPGIAIAEKDELKEIGHGRWEGMLEAEIERDYGELLKQWKTTPEVVQMPDGETLQQVWDRAIACWEAIVRERASAEFCTGLVVAHDAINKAILCYLFGLEPRHFWNIKQGNGAVSAIDYPDGLEGLPVLQSVNITTHLGAGIFDRTAAGAL